MLYALMLSLYVSANAADDSSRVVLSVPNTSGTDYINASFVDVSEACTLSAQASIYMSRQQCVHRHCSYIPASAVGSKLSGLLYHL